MKRELLILRHGKSDWQVNADDFHRPLKNRGKRGAQRMGVWLLQQNLVPDYIISSPAERAIVTAEKCCKVMGKAIVEIHQIPQIYEATPYILLRILEDIPQKAQRVMLVGHNPGLEQLLTYLVKGDIPLPEDGKLLPTATLARLTMPTCWDTLQTDCAELASITRPCVLPKLFPFPSVHDTQLRKRPAYYYTQSSVIPYRIHKGQLEILIVLSSKKKHWVIPKGIKEPELTLQSSAAQEAREEAGVEGIVSDNAIGSYCYEKWGATCTVTVYPMRVTKVIDKGKWEESHRSRKWVSPKMAACELKQDALKPIITQLTAMLHAK